MEFNETWQEARSQRPLPSLCFPSLSDNKMAAPTSDWLIYILLILWNRWMEFNETLKEARSQRHLSRLCLRVDLNTKMAAMASDWLRHFRRLLWNSWTEFNETLQEGRSQRPLPSLCFLADMKLRWPPLTMIDWDFSTSSLQPVNGIKQNLTGSKVSMSSTKFVFFGLIGNQVGSPGLWLAKTFSTSLKPQNGIQRNLTGNKNWTSATKCMFWAYPKTKMTALESDLLRRFELLCNCSTEFNETWQEALSQPKMLLHFGLRQSMISTPSCKFVFKEWVSFFWVHGEWIVARNKPIVREPRMNPDKKTLVPYIYNSTNKDPF